VRSERGGRHSSGRLESADVICGVTVFGVLLAVVTGAAVAGLFLVLTLIGLMVLRRLELPTALELCCSIGILLQGWGNALLLFERIGWYDKAVHFLTPMLVVPSLYVLLARAGALPPPCGGGLRRGTLGALVVTVAIGIALATVWELVEGGADRWLGTSLAHGYLETIDDLYSSLLGSLAAGAALAWWLAAGGRDLGADAVGAEAFADSE
jgi:hypothetical protein